MLVIAGSYGAGNDNVSDLMLFAAGLAVSPARLIRTSRLDGTGDAPRIRADMRQHLRRTRWTVT
jgi:hypothetical protein